MLLGIDIASASEPKADSGVAHGFPAGIEGATEAWERLQYVLGEE